MGYFEFQSIEGKTFKSVIKRSDDEEILFTENDGTEYRMYHSHECCESVFIDDVCGDLQDLVDSPIIRAEERSNSDGPVIAKYAYDDSHTWTFYEVATIKGSVTIRWYGSSNGYYSESVQFEKVEQPPTKGGE